MNHSTDIERRRILVVEDESMLRSMVATILESRGYTVQTAATSQEAHEIWSRQECSFDLLITDMILSDGCMGTELAERLLGEQPTLKTVYCSGFGTDQFSESVTQLIEGDNFLRKPYSTRTLLHMVEQCLGIQSSIASAA
jgi:CheY-like chemotaxis protein